jgi:PAS domain S-box-containing protein
MQRTPQDLLDFVDTAGIGLHWIAPDGTIIWANPADYQPLGYAGQEYIGHDIREFHADGHVIADILNRLSHGERLQNYEARLRCKDGSTRKVLITSSARCSDAGEFLHTRCFTVDISDRRPEGIELQLEALSREVERLRLVASRERGLLEAVLKHSPHGIIVSDARGRLVLQNEASERIWAGSATVENIQGWDLYRAFHADGRPFEPSDWSMARAVMHGVTTVAEEIRIQRFDDTYGVVLGSAAPIHGPDGSPEGGIAVFADITTLKEQEERLKINEERYLTTLKSIGDAVIATDAVGSVTFLNRIAEQLTGWPVEAARGKPLSEVFRILNEQTRDVVESPVEKVLRTGAIVGLANHTVLIARDGSEKAIDDSGAPIFDTAGNLAGVVLVFRDVTERRREDERREFITRASALLSSSLDYAATLASVARLAVPTIADWCAVDILGIGHNVERLAVAHVDPAKVSWARDIAKRYPPDPKSPYGVHEVLRTGKSQIMSEIPDTLLVAAAVDEEHLHIIRELGLKSSMIVPLRHRERTLGAISFVAAESGRRFGAKDLALAEELANTAALAVENSRLYRDAQEANRSKDEFLATVSHELRTPLNAMLGWSQLLRTSQLSDEKRAQALETIERNARAQSQLIDDLLDVSRITSGNLRLEARTLDLIAIIEAAIDSVRLAAESKGVRIELVCDEEARHATGDPVRLQQVVWNLVSNGVKFTDRGGVVVVRLQQLDSQAEIRVTDTGIGIDAQLLPHIFERFKQGDGTTTRSKGGLGLGLAIVKHLVELHGGTIKATSDGAQRGSAFTVRLPLSAVQLQGLPPMVIAPPRIVAPSLAGLHVLVVDDEVDAQTLLVAVLESRHARVTVSGSAADAIREIERSAPDVLVSDIGMPEADGYELIRRVRRSLKKSATDLPAVALTAYARMEDRSRAMLAGFQSHIAKPVDPDELLIVVATLAGRTSMWPGPDTGLPD